MTKTDSTQHDRLIEFAHHCIDSFEYDDPDYPHDKGMRAKGRFVAKWAYKALTGEDGTYDDIERLKMRNRPRFTLREMPKPGEPIHDED
jgi:hypothetical protein